MTFKGLFGVIIGIAALLLAAVNVSAQDGGVLRVGIGAPVVLDPALHTNDPETALNRAIYDYLVEVLPDASIGPNLATEWTISEDSLTYSFTLAEGITFHDGSPFTSADVVYTFERLRDVSSPALNLLGSEYEVSAPDESTVVFTLPEVNADFLYGVGARQALIVQDGAETPNEIAEGDNPYINFNGTGPFVLQSFDPGAGATLVRNENYWRGPVSLAGLEFVYIDDVVAQVDAVLSGDVNFVSRIPINQVDRLESAETVNVLQIATSQHAVIRVRTDAGSIGENPLVRQALKYATDRVQLNDVLLQGRGVIGNNDPIAPVFGAFYDDTLVNQDEELSRDEALVRACDLLTEAGVNPLEGTLYAPNAFEYPDLAALLQQQWAETGCINVDIQVIEEGLYYDTSLEPNYFDVQIGITGWGEISNVIPSVATPLANAIFELLDGQNPTRIEHLWQTMFRGGFFPAGNVVGSAMSALTRNQVIAFVLAAAICFLFLMSGLEMVQALFRGWAPAPIVAFVQDVSLLSTFDTITQGVIDVRHLVLFGSLIAACLFINTAIVELNKGR
ncbi:MAG: hypothetical protein HC828_12875 [Blastochloris sp.]|nr:hypothetical protein [Blastochloris sp.]